MELQNGTENFKNRNGKDALMASCLYEEIKIVLQELRDSQIDEQLKDESSVLTTKILAIAHEGFIIISQFIKECPEVLNSYEFYNLETSSNDELWYERRIDEMKSKINEQAKNEISNLPSKTHAKNGRWATFQGYYCSIDGAQKPIYGEFIDEEYHYYIREWIEGYKIAKYLPIYEAAFAKLRSENSLSLNKDSSDSTMNKNKENAGSQKTKEIQPIWWKGSGRQLGYLFDKLKTNGLIDGSCINKNIKEHFVDMDKKTIKNVKANRSGAINQTKHNKPKGGDLIDKIVSDTKKHENPLP